MSDDIKLIPVQDYAEMVGKSRQAIMKGIKSGNIPAVHQDDPKQPKGKWMVIIDATDATDATDAKAKAKREFGNSITIIYYIYIYYLLVLTCKLIRAVTLVIISACISLHSFFLLIF